MISYSPDIIVNITRMGVLSLGINDEGDDNDIGDTIDSYGFWMQCSVLSESGLSRSLHGMVISIMIGAVGYY